MGGSRLEAKREESANNEKFAHSNSITMPPIKYLTSNISRPKSEASCNLLITMTKPRATRILDTSPADIPNATPVWDQLLRPATNCVSVKQKTRQEAIPRKLANGSKEHLRVAGICLASYSGCSDYSRQYDSSGSSWSMHHSTVPQTTTHYLEGRLMSWLMALQRSQRSLPFLYVPTDQPGNAKR